MAVKVPEPNKDKADLYDWQKLLSRTTLQGGGFILLNLENMNNTGVPRVLQGSRFELNGVFFSVEETENISGQIVLNQINYIYAVPEGEKAVFVYSITKPEFDPVMGGWFNEEKRAIAKVYPGSDNKFWNKVILDGESAINNFNVNSLPTFGGDLFIAAPLDKLVIEKLDPGAYYLEVRGGKGGNGGDGGNNYYPAATTIPKESGEVGSLGELKKFAFIVTNTVIATLYRGNDGNKGENGEGYNNNNNYYSMGAGGGSGKNGKLSYIHIENIGFVFAYGGRGGKGGNGAGLTATNYSGGKGGAAPDLEKPLTWNELRGILTTNNGEDGIGVSNSSSGFKGGKGATTFSEATTPDSGCARIYKINL
jgi:hypothetical protein